MMHSRNAQTFERHRSSGSLCVLSHRHRLDRSSASLLDHFHILRRDQNSKLWVADCGGGRKLGPWHLPTVSKRGRWWSDLHFIIGTQQSLYGHNFWSEGCAIIYSASKHPQLCHSHNLSVIFNPFLMGWV